MSGRRKELGAETCTRAYRLDLGLQLLQLSRICKAVLQQQRANVLDGVARTPDALNLVPRAVCAARVRYRVAVIPVRVLHDKYNERMNDRSVSSQVARCVSEICLTLSIEATGSANSWKVGTAYHIQPVQIRIEKH
jgi:hypothetical protein